MNAEPGLGPEGAAGEHHAIDAKPAVVELRLQLFDRCHESCSADLVRSSIRNQIGTASCGHFSCHDLFGHLFALALAGEDDSRTEQVVEEQVPRRDRRGVTAQNGDAPQTARGCSSSGLPDMVRLHRTQRDQGVGVAPQRFAHNELELARLVSSGGKPGLIIALDEQTRPTESARETRHLMQWCRQVTEANARELIGQHCAILTSVRSTCNTRMDSQARAGLIPSLAEMRASSASTRGSAGLAGGRFLGQPRHRVAPFRPFRR